MFLMSLQAAASAALAPTPGGPVSVAPTPQGAAKQVQFPYCSLVRLALRAAAAAVCWSGLVSDPGHPQIIDRASCAAG